ncbi:MAG: nicotinamide-nucleotide amidohydrolase family protein [Gammaproteobacteria bacterium SHHR-1]|uniref:CinA family protein n=1 Tax=Magnetovirga frankeli TaxID=947516 RepID=UPI0012941099|nr:nicotinamide-nucleotide amidohydrolase family protein [gamma proteobacterium SS-5]
MNDACLSAEAEKLLAELIRRGLSLACAESCSGGWIAKLITDIPGSSAVLERGFVTYSNAAKQEMLGVPAVIIQAQGAVSRETVAAMVSGALAHSRADLALAVSGIAGPSGGSLEKPVGSVWLGWGRRGQPPLTRLERFSGERDQVRRQAVLAALRGVWQLF